MADLADHAYAHITAVLGSESGANDAAQAAVRHGGRSLTSVLGHARLEALARAGDTEIDVTQPVPIDLTALALALTRTRPADERAVLDLDARHGLDRERLSRALGLSMSETTAMATEIAERWREQLDPVVLAHLGPGSCPGLAAVLASAGAELPPPTDDVAPTLGTLIAAGPVVADHVAGCDACRDRLVAMVSVRSLVAQRPLETAPPEVRSAAAASRVRRPVPLEVASGGAPPVGRRRWLWAAATTTAVVTLALLGGALFPGREPSQKAAVEALTKVPVAGSAFDVEPTVVRGLHPAPVRLSNDSDQALEWSAVPDATWLAVEPTSGRLEPGETVPLRVTVDAAAPEGDLRGSVQISGRDGSAAVVRLVAAVERPPDLAAMASGCLIDATVEDEGEVAGVALHWVEPPTRQRAPSVEHVDAMASTSTGYLGKLPDDPRPLVWWVTAADARGNRSRTANQILDPNSCPAPPAP